MTKVVVSERALRDFQRIADFVEEGSAGAGAARIAAIVAALDVLSTSPQIGRPAPEGHCELIIGRGARGYIALYAYLPREDVVVIAAVKGQREGGYAAPHEEP